MWVLGNRQQVLGVEASRPREQGGSGLQRTWGKARKGEEVVPVSLEGVKTVTGESCGAASRRSFINSGRVALLLVPTVLMLQRVNVRMNQGSLVSGRTGTWPIRLRIPLM